ncbi:WD40 repeat-like protein [Periconia macrospinosa]|uniref:WD40 repeat-like protein n=1 Tax=Periconia macrospinosa TaxID=97972 RepID=A0A2V1E238_9PLEO|nr:WD40 repeat-like protein [Periconia macrospinosa]
MHDPDELPSLRATLRLQGNKFLENNEWFDVRFYPYTQPGEDPVFVAVGGRFAVVCRCIQDASSSIEILREFSDDMTHHSNEWEGSYNSVEWSQARNGDPLLCISGESSRINVLNVTTGKLVTTLIGHGFSVNDLAVSPVDPTILASCSMDHAVRIWSLDPAHAKQPTAAICYGQGHQEQVLTLAYHRTGKYLLSAGIDTRVNLWMIPDDLKSHLGTDKPAIIHYPHFATTEVHNDIIDCVRWYNDYILSQAREERTIQLWKIDNFNSNRPPPNPAPPPLPTTVDSHSKVTVPTSSISGTRSAWGGRFQRLLQFEVPNLETFFVRFSLFHELGAHPVLAAGNERSKVFFWDLQRLEGLGIGEDESENTNSTTAANATTKKSELPRHVRDASTASVASGHSSTSASKTNARLAKSVKKGPTYKYGIGSPYQFLPAHKSIELPNYNSLYRHFAWSRDGQWCVGVGSHGVITIMQRWKDGVPPLEKEAGT